MEQPETILNFNRSHCTSGLRSVARTLASGALLGAALALATPAQAGFHLWTIREVYTDASGTLQFIEFFTGSGSQQFVGGQSITVSSGGTNHVFTIPSSLPSDSASHAFMIGTAGITNFGAPKPDYTIPANFVFSGGGTITYFAQGGGAYTALPTDGVLSRTWVGGANSVNSPQNFAGTVGQIIIANLPPTVSITNPLNNALFAAPGTVPVGVSASDSDGTVASVQLLTNGIAAATNTLAPFGFTLTNLAAGYYTLRARAQDNQSGVATSAPVVVRVAGQPVLSFARGTNGPLQFQFNTATGVSYVVERALPLTNFSPLVTNPGSGGVLRFSETNSVPAQGTYRVRVQ